jgi:hypothetical protein
METTKPLAPNGLVILGALTEDGSICKISSFHRHGGHTDWVFEVPDVPMVQPTTLVDSGGNHWSTSDI